MTKWLDHSSIIGKIGGYPDKYLNPISWITGGKSTHLTSTVLPEKVNSGLSTVMKPFDKVDQTINPVRKIPIVNRVSNIVANKPGDAAALVAGAYFGGAAALGGGGAGGAGGGAVAGGSGAAGGADVGGLAALDSAAVTSEGAAPGLMAGGGGAAAGGGAVATGSTADVAGLQAADSAAVDAEGAEPGLTQGYGPAQSSAGSQTQQYRPQQQQQRKRQQQAQPYSPINGLSEDQYQALVNQATGQIAQSSKTVKTRGATQAAMQRGLAGAHPVDTNGVHIAAIQELHKQIESLGKQIAAAKAKRAAKGA